MAKPAKKVAVSAAVVENKTSINRKARLERHLKKHPNDAQAKKAQTSTKAPRKAPKVKGVTLVRNLNYEMLLESYWSSKLFYIRFCN